MTPAQAELRLPRVLAGVELRRGRRGLVRIGGQLRGGQSQRILGALVDVAEQHQHLVARAGPGQAPAGQRPLCRAVRPAAVDLQVGRAQSRLPAVAEWGAGLEPRLAQAGAAGVQIQFGESLAHRRAHQRDHAARAVAVQGGEGPAQHLDPRGGGQVEVRHLPLAIGHRGRDAVGVQAQPAHAERRPRAEAARRELQVLRVVLPVVGGQAGHAIQGLGQMDAGAGAAQRVGVDHRRRIRRVLQRALRGAAGDHHRRQRGRLSLRRGQAPSPQRRGADPFPRRSHEVPGE